MPSAAPAIAALVLLLPGAAVAQLLEGTPPPRRLVLSSSAVLRYNPLGLAVDASLVFRQRLFARDAAALRDNFIGLGATARVTPAGVRAGVVLEAQPLTLVKAWASAEVVRWFGNFGYFQSFPSPAADVSDAAQEARRDLPGVGAQAATGTQLAAGAVLLAKAGPVVVRDSLTLARLDFPLRAGDRVFFDPYWAMIVASPGSLAENDLDLLWPREDGLTFGLRWTWGHAFLAARHFAPGEAQDDPNSPSHRAGPLLAWRLWRDEGRAVTAPTVFALAQVWLKHRYRAGAEHSQALPYLAAGVAFWGDVLPLTP